jgi:hypothetical protein
MFRKAFIAAALAATPLCYAQFSTAPQPITPIPMSPDARPANSGTTTTPPGVATPGTGTVTPGSSLGASGSTLGAPGSTLGTPSTPGVSSGSPNVPSTGAFNRPGDTTLPGSATTPGLSTLPGVNGRDSASVGSSTSPPPADTLRLPPPVTGGSGVLGPAPSSSGVIGGSRPGCIPGSISNPC